MLARLYDASVVRGDTGRFASSADVERNLTGTGLRRTDLSWRTLLFARPALPTLVSQPFRSDLLPAQGLGILRRNEGSLYVSLDYGHSGGGHGHPDRLNFTLMNGARRWFDDPGTGSYVDPSLHWYRSTLAHNAPIVNGHSQPRVHGDLLAYEDDDREGWVSAQAELAPGLIVQRTIVTLADYVVDELQWEGVEPHEVALPMHGVDVPSDVLKTPVPIAGGNGTEDGFAFLTDTSSVALPEGRALELVGACDGLRGWVFAQRGATLWSASAPAAPGHDGTVPMLLLRQSAATGSFLSVWSWSTAIRSVERDGDVLVVLLADGTRERHRRAAEGWLIETSGGGTRLVELGGRASRLGESSSGDFQTTPTRPSAPLATITLPATFELGEPHYRRSEFTWQGASAPRAVVTVTRPTPGTVQVDVDVPSSQRLFVPLVTENQLDNEPASINGDSVQLYALAGERTAGLLLVPEVASVGQRPVDGWTNDLTVDAKWRPTSSGYHLEATIHIDGRTPEFSLDVLVNEVVSGRARRRGQLVLSGAEGEFVYLRGDRHDPSRLLRFSLANV
jgi:hypothetical protein